MSHATGDDGPAFGSAYAAVRPADSEEAVPLLDQEQVLSTRDDPLNIEATHHGRVHNDGSRYPTTGTAHVLSLYTPDTVGWGATICSSSDFVVKHGPQQKSPPYGVSKMETLSRHLSSKIPVYLSIYIIIFAQSMSHTTPKVVEPFLLSLSGGHSYTSAINTVAAVSRSVLKVVTRFCRVHDTTFIGYVPQITSAVCRLLAAKVLDIFGRAEALSTFAAVCGTGRLPLVAFVIQTTHCTLPPPLNPCRFPAYVRLK